MEEKEGVGTYKSLESASTLVLRKIPMRKRKGEELRHRIRKKRLGKKHSHNLLDINSSVILLDITENRLGKITVGSIIRLGSFGLVNDDLSIYSHFIQILVFQFVTSLLI